MSVRAQLDADCVRDRCAPTQNPVGFSRLFHRHGRACPAIGRGDSAATDGRDKADHDGKAGFIEGGSAPKAGVNLQMTAYFATKLSSQWIV